CKNLWRNRLRKKKKLIIEDRENRFDVGIDDPIMVDIENQEREHLYRKHFQKLSTDNKKILSLFFEGRSMLEISKVIGCS
ncbi:sigma-70 family RNA polymerase sigma factor, partial [Aquimarina celericrescens]|nr:sigma-70 family RNA polymerase sigma factor [Aquimarina celericrescens]